MPTKGKSENGGKLRLLKRITSTPGICGGRACIKGTRIEVTTVLDSLASGNSSAELIEHFPSLKPDDIRAAIAYGAELAREGVWKAALGEN